MKILKYKLQNGDILTDCELQTTDAAYEANLAIAQAEASDGNVVVEDVKTTDAESSPTGDIEQRLEVVESNVAQIVTGLEEIADG